jgi:hypothetical protein
VHPGLGPLHVSPGRPTRAHASLFSLPLPPIAGARASAALARCLRETWPGRGRDVARQSELGPRRPAPRGISTARPPPLCCPSPHLKKEATGYQPIFFSPARHSSCPSTPERRTRFPHRPSVHLAGFPPPEPSSVPDSVRASPPSAPFW